MGDCIFCRIVAQEIAGRIAYEDADLVAFHDINPQAPVHILIVPRRHIESLNAVTQEDAHLLGRMLVVARDLAREHGLADDGYRLVLNTNRAAGQSVFHLHFHLLGGRFFHWPPG
ncbi:MAG: histidine triad nucleotide-binding protein [Armatimonadetes bacterium]|nr:histidine triad nucleotide-binding protein [Armatimonadota bacterium]MDW8121590.1 histidine triad nucleotide-binding protein [Armatimonadota bacterium]